jgi:hypothetical protein
VALTTDTVAEETVSQLTKAQKKSQSNWNQITEATLVSMTYLHKLWKARIANDTVPK